MERVTLDEVWRGGGFLFCGLLVSGCATPARPQPLRPAEVVAPRPAAERALRDAAPDVSDDTAEPSDLVADADDAGVAEAQAPAPRAPFHCFAWVQAPQASTDCFRTEWRCDRALEQMKAKARNAPPTCKPAYQAWCTKIGYNYIKKSKEHCFSSAFFCDQFVGGERDGGERATDCAER